MTDSIAAASASDAALLCLQPRFHALQIGGLFTVFGPGTRILPPLTFAIELALPGVVSWSVAVRFSPGAGDFGVGGVSHGIAEFCEE